MIDQLKKHIEEVNAFTAQDPEALEAFRVRYLGKKGLLNDYFRALKDIPKEEKREFGQKVNELKEAATEKVEALREQLQGSQVTERQFGDLTRPGSP